MTSEIIPSGFIAYLIPINKILALIPSASQELRIAPAARTRRKISQVRF